MESNDFSFSLGVCMCASTNVYVCDSFACSFAKTRATLVVLGPCSSASLVVISNLNLSANFHQFIVWPYLVM